ncbi:broad specificity phosphatase PhoE [Catalinimonas alkaloidigena]|uniref:histidine phosphatase family protein n=1 Tax=Catalinimonas alkaloidigena TaxID=1075417 RepID=UPI0024050A71|nr:histidine phosphatase family protein [Catalinimonas alkaloidigena]MDF9797425.1 broad specificity phosphatase PhoE [Catalinimonas alkaloidigena]
MQKKKIYLIRHGQTEYNRKGVVQGSGIDAPLNNFGRLQAKHFYENYKEIPFQHVYTSVLQRSIQSVEHFLDMDLPHTKLPGLNEINWGEKEGKVANAEDSEYYASIIKSWTNGELDRAIEGGESPNMVLERQKPALEKIIANQHEEIVLVCMHGRAMRIFLCLMLGYDLSRMDEFGHANLGLYLIEYDYESTTFEIILANEQSHLPEIPAFAKEDKKP